MLAAVPTADVILKNPTRFAIALRYDRKTMRAPKIVAKGQRLMADRIKQIARENNVPVIEDKPLARALFSRPIGAEVPAHLYRAVARLLVLVHQARFAGSRPAARQGTHAASPDGARTVPSRQMARSWWTGAASSAAFDAAAGRRAVDFAAAASLYAAVDPAPEAAVLDPDGAAGDAWLDAAALGPADVDEEALAEAMAEDELADITPDEMASFEADLVADDASAEADDPTEIDDASAQADEEQLQ
jgi:flagellar biosynthetic protein FlhB